jgi:transcription termination factor NusA
LIGWEIDIKSEEAKRREVLEQMNQLEPQPEAAEGPEVETVSPAGEPESGVRLDQLPGCGEVTQARLEEAGIRTVEKLAEIPLDELMAIPGIGEKTARRLKSGAQKMLGIEQDVEESTAE